MMRLAGILLLLLSFGAPAWAYDGPIIDMHLHAWPLGEHGNPDKPKNVAARERALAKLEEYNVVLAATSGPEAFLTAWSAAEPERLLPGPIFPCINGENPTWFQYRCFEAGGDLPDPAWLEAKYSSGEYGVMGELYNQYAGVPYGDPRMDPYYEMAQRLGIPVAFHTHSAPPLTAHQCCPDFRIRNGNPLLVEDVLARYPKLKVYLMHANALVYPEVMDLMSQYPKLYVELSTWDWVLPREKFHRLLRMYKEAGLLGRIMFGSDGHDYGDSLEAYNSADFLTERELAGIFCKNAERFLRREKLCD